MAVNFNAVVDKIQDEIKLITATLKDKGSNRFGRALLIALACPFTAYLLAYGPAQRKLGEVAGRLQVARNTAKHADTYKDLKDRLLMSYMQLPLPKDRSSFLADTVKEALRAEGIVPMNFNPATETDMPGGTVQTLGITMRVKFPALMSFLARLENNRPVIHVNSLDISKMSSPIGVNEVNCAVSTIIITERF